MPRKLARLWLPVLSLVIALLVESGYRIHLLQPLDEIYNDTWHHLAPPRPPARHVALVVVDPVTLAAYADEPLVFFGPHFASAIERLRDLGVRAIGLDFLLALSPDAWLSRLGNEGKALARDYDAALRRAIARGEVLLVASMAQDRAGNGDRFALPHPDYLFAVPDLALSRGLALADLEHDPDGVVRHYRTRVDAKPHPDYAGLDLPHMTLAAQLVQRHFERGGPTGVGAAVLRARLAQQGPRRIAYAGPPGSIPRVPLLALLQADGDLSSLQWLADRVVIIGADYPAMGDVHFTPYAAGFSPAQRRLMAGAEVHAHIVETLLGERSMTEFTSPARQAMAMALAWISLLVLQRLPLLPATGVIILLSCLGIALAYGLFVRDILLPQGVWQTSLFLAYAAGVARMFTGEARARRHMASLFRRYVSDAAVKVLLEGERMPELGGRLTQLTVLFSDIRNFTTLSERLSPPEVVEVLNAYFDRVCQPVLEAGGSIDKYIGDAIMVEFGAPLPLPDHAERALRVALRIQEIAQAFQSWMQARFPDRELPPFAVGVGVHTGQAVVGSIGSRRRSEFTAIGDTVNVASRLEGQTKSLGAGILASRECVDAVGRDRLRLGQHAIVQVKGHAEPIEVFEVLGFIA